jgi:hypothetical protein
MSFSPRRNSLNSTLIIFLSKKKLDVFFPPERPQMSNSFSLMVKRKDENKNNRILYHTACRPSPRMRIANTGTSEEQQLSLAAITPLPTPRRAAAVVVVLHVPRSAPAT